MKGRQSLVIEGRSGWPFTAVEAVSRPGWWDILGLTCGPHRATVSVEPGSALAQMVAATFETGDACPLLDWLVEFMPDHHVGRVAGIAAGAKGRGWAADQLRATMSDGW